MNKESDHKEQRGKESVLPGGPGGFFIYNALGDEEIYYADRNVIELFGCENMDEFRELTGNSFKGMVHPDDLDRVESSILAQTFKSDRRHDYVRYRIITKQGECRYVEDFGHLIRSDEKNVFFYVFIIDVEKAEYERKESNSYAEMQIFNDNNKVDRLTGLLNMDAFYDQAKEVLMERATEGAPSTIVVFDILGIREINRTLGHAEGDARICSLAETIQKYMPEGSVIFRGHEADLIAVCKNISQMALKDNIVRVVQANKSPILFGIGSSAPVDTAAAIPSEEGSMMHALEEAQLSIGIKKMLNSRSHQSQALTSLVRALEEVDEDTKAHVTRTQKTGLALGHRIGLSDCQLTLLELLCLLHDIGKIAVPLEILNKPGRLTTEEWAVLRSHPEKGYQIATATEELKPLADVILYHHERWDGKGYPTGLAKDDIPVLSRIISIVDAYDAMVNDRCYRKALLPVQAKKEIKDNAGTQFDPYLATEFLSLLGEDPSLSVGAKTGGGEVRVFDHSDSEDSETGTTRPIKYAKYTLDMDDVIIDVDGYFEEMTGYSREDAIGKLTQFDLIPEDEKHYYLEQVKKQFVRGDVAYLKHPLERKDGSVIQVICNGERYFDSSVRAFRSKLLVFETE